MAETRKAPPPPQTPGRPRKGEVREPMSDAERSRRYLARKRAKAREAALVPVTVYLSQQATDRLTELSIRRHATRAEVLEKLVLEADPLARE